MSSRAEGAGPPKSKRKGAGVRAPLPARGALLASYRGGDTRGAWRSLVALGPRVRARAVLPEAREVARETMKRARDAIATLAERLLAQGYRFLEPDEVLVPPDARASARLEELEQRVGPLPLSLHAAYEIIGSCNFCGSHPEWDNPACLALPGLEQEGTTEVWLTDPLTLFPLDLGLQRSIGRAGGEPFALPVSPDAHSKAGYSGGPPCEITVPCDDADARLAGDRHELYFVDHLRLALEHGGFPGFASISGAPRSMIDALVEGIAPI